MTKIVTLGVTSENINSDKIKSYLKLDNVIGVPDIFLSEWYNQNPFQIWYGSRYSAKSYTKAIQYLLLCSGEEYFRGIFMRYAKTAVRNSQYQLFKDVCEMKPILKGAFRFYDSRLEIVHLETGNKMFGGSFEDPGKVMSIADVTRLWLEEPITHHHEINVKDIVHMQGSLRSRHDIEPIVDLTFNPISIDTDIYKQFFDDKNSYKYRSLKLKANYDDNPFCPKNRIEYLDDLQRIDPEQYEVDGRGNWGSVKTGLEYYNRFKRSSHVKKLNIIDAPVHVTMDFNANPYMAIGVWQVNDQGDRISLNKIKEYAMKSPLNTVEDGIDAVVSDFEEYFKYGLFFYGDVHAKRTTMLRDTRSFLMAIIESFKGYLYRGDIRIPNANPLHSERRRLINRALSGAYKYDIFIDEKCELSIADFQKVQINANGAKLKAKDKQGFERYGHFSDGDDYFLHYLHHHYLPQ